EPPRAEVEAEKERLRREWRISHDDRVVVTLSRISPEKGQDLLLEALRRADERVVAVICGDAAFMQGAAFKRRLEAMARGRRVIFPGHLGGATKRAALELGGVFVSASRHESYGLTTMEAMAAGLPVVAVDTPGSRETLDADCGLLVPPGQPDQLWQAVKQV